MKSESGMSYEEATKILGLKSGETVENYRRAFEEVRKHMQRLRDEAETDERRETYEKELVRFEEALIVATHQRPRKSKVGLLVTTLVLVAGLGVAGYIYGPGLMDNQAAKREMEARLPEAATAVEARNWSEAEEIYQELLAVVPRSKAAREGLKRIAEGKDIEKKQQVGFLLGRAQALMELRRWDEADKAMSEALEMEPDDPQLVAMNERMQEGRRADEIDRLVEEVDEAEREEQWAVVLAKISRLREEHPENSNLERFQASEERATMVLAKYAIEAKELYEKALALDNGQYSEAGLQLLREAQRLSASPEAAELYRTMSSYVQTVAVPGDAATLAEGLALIRPGDKVLLAAGTYQEQVLIPAGVTVESVGGKAVLVGKSGAGSVVVVEGEGEPVRLLGLEMNHSGVSNLAERYPVVLVSGGSLILEDCSIGFGSGHGLAITNGGSCEVIGSEIKGCGWDGIAVVGEGSKVICKESRCVSNFHHGLDAWDGGIAIVERSRFQENGLTGILLTSSGSGTRILNSGIERNREVGIVVTRGTQVDLVGNLISGNLLGGVFAEDIGTRLSLISNQILKNGEAGLVVTSEAILQKDEENEVTENIGKQRWLDAEVRKVEPDKALTTQPES